MTGYTRNDTSNNIADGNVINAADLDGEFDAIQTAFNNSTGHTHDGTAANGAPITKVGPSQDVTVSATEVAPKLNNTVSLGTSTLQFKDLHIDGTANIDSLVADTADINGGTIDGTTIGATTASTGAFTTVTANTFTGALSGNASTATSAGKWTTARALSFTGDVTGSGNVDGSVNVATAMTLANSGVTAGSYGSGSAIPSITVDAKGRVTGATNNSISTATSTATGVVKLASDTDQTVAFNAVTATAGRTYGVQLNASDQMVVNVPWTDTNTTYSKATTTNLGLVKLEDDTVQTVAANTVTATASRTYGVQLNSADQMVVNVPWTDTNTTYNIATSTVPGIVEVFSDTDQAVAANAVTAVAGRTYGVQLNSANQMVVNVPWTDTNTTYGIATSTVAGIVEVFSDTDQTVAANAVTATAGRTYGIQLNSANQMVVNVPWTDNNTTYTGSKGITLTGTDFRITGNEIPGSIDLNTYRTTGFYAQNANADAASGSNYPTANAGILQVINDDYGNGLHTTQLYSQYNSTNYYIRTYYNGSWTSWRNLAEDTNTTYSQATASTLGLIKIEDNTVQTVAANAVTATASRTYGVQVNSSGQAVVNVPWSDTNTTYGIATATTAGLVELFSNTDQTVAANAVTTVAGRTYGIQLNSANQMVVNVPWEALPSQTGNSGEFLTTNGTTASWTSTINGGTF